MNWNANLKLDLLGNQYLVQTSDINLNFSCSELPVSPLTVLDVEADKTVWDRSGAVEAHPFCGVLVGGPQGGSWEDYNAFY